MNKTMEAKICFTVLCALFLQTYNVKCAESAREKLNPCWAFPCTADSLCWYDSSGTPKCENACDYTKCKGDEYCLTEVGTCGNASCRPLGKCHSKNPPNPCTGVRCPNGQQCTVVVPLNEGPTPICGPDPCINHRCCVRSDGGLCEKNGCYLQKIDFSCRPGQACQVIPVCRDPCVVQNVVCKEPGQFCYTSNAVCITSPCNPIPECRKPCNTDIVNVCDQGQKCRVIWINCVTDKNSPFYDPFCKPKEICEPSSFPNK